MVIDTSAILAILQNEPERRAFNERIEAASSRALSVANWLESSIVLDARFGSAGVASLDALVETAEIRLLPVDARQARLARVAYTRYGKGKHPASLNFGDCFAYALAEDRSEPLLYKGDEFVRTPIPSAI